MTGQAGGRPSGGGGMSWMFIFLFMMIIFISPGTRAVMGAALSYLFNPIIGFAGTAPVWSIFFGSAIIVTISYTVRHFLTDWVKLARNQRYMKAFNKELSEARKSQNQQRLQKLMELQPTVMQRQMEVQGQTMKPSIVTMFLFIAFITWIYVFVSIAAVKTIGLPWEAAWPLEKRALFPYGMWLYIIFSIPVSQMVVNTWKYIRFSRRLRVLDETQMEDEVVLA